MSYKWTCRYAGRYAHTHENQDHYAHLRSAMLVCACLGLTGTIRNSKIMIYTVYTIIYVSRYISLYIQIEVLCSSIWFRILTWQLWFKTIDSTLILDMWQRLKNASHCHPGNFFVERLSGFTSSVSPKFILGTKKPWKVCLGSPQVRLQNSY